MKTTMKRNFLKSSIATICFLLVAFAGFAANTVKVELQNCTSTINTLNFDIVLTNTDANSAVLNFFQTGIDFNYGEIANGGTITAAYVPGTSDMAKEHKEFNDVNVFVDPTSHQLRITGQVVMTQANGTVMPANTPLRLGTFQLINTHYWTPSSSPSFVFSTAPSSAIKTQIAAGVFAYKAVNALKIEPSITCNSVLNADLTTGTAPISATSTLELTAYPNPAHNKVNVDFTSLSKEKYVIKVSDVAGSVLIEKTQNAVKGQSHLELNLENFAKGMYVLTFTSGTESKKMSIAVE